MPPKLPPDVNKLYKALMDMKNKKASIIAGLWTSLDCIGF
jgi:hypothetical protein